MRKQAGAELLEQVGPDERTRLVRYCIRFTSDPDVAEDLTQQTLFEAWRLEGKLWEAEMRQSWLFGIARNLCLHWTRQHARELSHTLDLHPYEDGFVSNPVDHLADPFDLEVELERDELALILDRAMALLPPETRTALVQRYIEELPQAEIAERLGVSEGAVEARLQRGKLGLRKVLVTQLRDEAAVYGLIRSGTEGWQETRIWCPACGQHRLVGLLRQPGIGFALRCSGCSGSGSYVAHSARPEVYAGVKGYKPALNRLMNWTYGYYRHALSRSLGSCPGCELPAPLWPSRAEDGGVEIAGVDTRCELCAYGERHALDGSKAPVSLLGFTLALPEVRRFWREHLRLRTIEGAIVEVEGGSAFVTAIESITDSARLEVIRVRHTGEVLGVYGNLVE